MATLAPSIMNYLYDDAETGTYKDFFIAGVSGGGTHGRFRVFVPHPVFDVAMGDMDRVRHPDTDRQRRDRSGARDGVRRLAREPGARGRSRSVGEDRVVELPDLGAGALEDHAVDLGQEARVLGQAQQAAHGAFLFTEHHLVSPAGGNPGHGDELWTKVRAYWKECRNFRVAAEKFGMVYSLSTLSTATIEDVSQNIDLTAQAIPGIGLQRHAEVLDHPILCIVGRTGVRLCRADRCAKLPCPVDGDQAIRRSSRRADRNTLPGPHWLYQE